MLIPSNGVSSSTTFWTCSLLEKIAGYCFLQATRMMVKSSPVSREDTPLTTTANRDLPGCPRPSSFDTLTLHLHQLIRHSWNRAFFFLCEMRYPVQEPVRTLWRCWAQLPPCRTNQVRLCCIFCDIDYVNLEFVMNLSFFRSLLCLWNLAMCKI